MPITQVRMISVLQAARTLLDDRAVAQTALRAARAGQESQGGNLSLAQAAAKAGDYESAFRHTLNAYNDLERIANDLFSFDHLIPVLQTITIEEAHFKAFSRHNDHQRKFQARKRKRAPQGIADDQTYRETQRTLQQNWPENPARPDPAADEIPEIGENYTREDYEREKRARQVQDAQTGPVRIK